MPLIHDPKEKSMSRLLLTVWSVVLMKYRPICCEFICSESMHDLQAHVKIVTISYPSQCTVTCRDCECILDREPNLEKHFRILLIEKTKMERMLVKDVKNIAIAYSYSRIPWQKSMPRLPMTVWSVVLTK